MDSQLSTSTQPFFVCTVGGSPAPIIYSLTQHAPKFALFLCSASSATAVEEQILPALPEEIANALVHTVHILRDEQDLLACVRDMRTAVSEAGKAFGLGSAPLLADFTGGTKVMSAALVLALAEYNVHFTYIGGGQRSKNGLGTVLEGTEKVMRLANPWEVLGFSPIRQLVDAFNFRDFARATSLAEELAQRGERAELFRALARLSEAYALWDGFDFPQARRVLPMALDALEALSAQGPCPALPPLLALVRKNCTELCAASDELATFEENKSPCPVALRDLAANALRREEQERFDHYKKLLSIKANSSADSVLSLSGGNQQKVFMARWLNTDAELLLFDNPTQGIDVGAKAEIYHLILELARGGKTVIINTLEIPELREVADVCYVLYEGRIVKRLEHDEIDEQTVMLYSTNSVSDDVSA